MPVELDVAPRTMAERVVTVAASILAAASFACHDAAPPTTPQPTPVAPTPAASGITELHLPTPDSSYNLLHPSVQCGARGCFMLACQHTLRDDHAGTRSDIVENTVGYKSAGTDMLNWTPVSNPIMSADEIDSTTDFSDPELLDLKPRLVAYSRLVPPGFDVLYMKETSDTVNWTPLKEVLRVPANTGISPTVLQNGSEYDLWVVDASSFGCQSKKTITVRRRSSTYTNFSHAVVDTTDLNEHSVPGMVPWHIEMIRGPADTPDSIIALVAMHPAGSECGNSSLYLGTTVDGLHFRMNPGPVRTGSDDSIFSMVYRSSGVYFSKDRTFVAMLSGTKSGGWPEARLARIKYDYDSLLASTLHGRTPTPLSVQLVPQWFSRSEGR
jgi:hypothetical protein